MKQAAYLIVAGDLFMDDDGRTFEMIVSPVCMRVKTVQWKAPGLCYRAIDNTYWEIDALKNVTLIEKG